MIKCIRSIILGELQKEICLTNFNLFDIILDISWREVTKIYMFSKKPTSLISILTGRRKKYA